SPTPLAILRKPLSACRVAVVTTAGLVAAGDVPFDDGVRGGDWSFRVIPGDVELASLGEFHRSASFDHAGIEADRNLALPLDRLHELVVDGTLGEVAPRHLSFMGSITAPGRLVQRSAPEATQLLVNDEVDLALLVPV
ncbi:MAG: glycine/sarcosine/betaine reductase selenoprotein B family protein, partial [Proteobacteria bacterium]|nr:glycine/sarcosine/betaine reductase selenoprotein B family protein [Pseudomonadota bacterium]